jgi:hypothetical protein
MEKTQNAYKNLLCHNVKLKYKIARVRCVYCKGKVHPCTGTEALYKPYGPQGE